MPPYVSWLYFSCWWWILKGKNTLVKLHSILVHGECRTWAGALGTLFKLNIHVPQGGSSAPSEKGLLCTRNAAHHVTVTSKMAKKETKMFLWSPYPIQPWASDWLENLKEVSLLTGFCPSWGLVCSFTHTPNIKCKRLLMVPWTENWHTF